MGQLKADPDILPSLSNGPRKRERRIIQRLSNLAIRVFVILGLLLLCNSLDCVGRVLQGSDLILETSLGSYLTDVIPTSDFSSPKEELCSQQQPLHPSSASHSAIVDALDGVYSSHEFKERAAEWLGGAVRLPTESYNGMLPVGQDPRWDIFYEFQAYLKSAFPKTHSSLNLITVNIHALVYHWKGSSSDEDLDLLPILLTAHQDVVPVDPSTLDRWTYPPYEGHFDGEWLWGRGSKDDKSGLIGILSAFEMLLEQGFKPKRTIVAAFGIDEESGGAEGAAKIAEYLESTYGKDGFALIVDEGGTIEDQGEVLVAQPNIGEKGFLNLKIQISTAGGHSSIPPAHTSIGLLSGAIVHLEANPHKPNLLRSSPVYNTLLCSAEHLTSLPSSLRRLIRKSRTSDRALKKLEKTITNDDNSTTERERRSAKKLKALLSTTQAVDIIEGGVKVNALPERASALVNHRITIESSVDELFDHLTNLFAPFALSNQLDFIAFGRNYSFLSTKTISAFAGTLELSDAYANAFGPAPVTPTDTAAYKLLSGTILAAHEGSKSLVPLSPSPLPSHEPNSGREKEKKKMIVAPGLMLGNTDTQFYWSLTRNIFRYTHLPASAFSGVHTVNERLRIDDFVDEIRFFSLLILNADESKDL